MKKTLLTRGFTLIELLVVIAIIGILAAVVIGSLNDARSGGQDASIKQSVSNVRTQAEVHYNTNNYSYAAVCSDTDIDSLLDAAILVASGQTYVPGTHGVDANVAVNGTVAANREASCRSNASAYVALSPLVASTTAFWCVDSTGVSRQISNPAPIAGDYTCL